MKKFFGIIACLSFFLLLGTVGGIEHDLLPLGEGIIICLASILTLWISAGFAGAYDRSRQREWYSHQRQA